MKLAHLFRACALFVITTSASAANLYVSAGNTAPAAPYASLASAAPDIQSAIDAATPGDTILVNNGTYTAGSTVVVGTMKNRVAINKAVTVQSLNGPAVTTIQGKGPIGGAAIRCVYVGANAVLTGFTLIGGATADTGDVITERSGGGIFSESTGVINRCIITANTASYGGGGVYGSDGAIFNDCTVSANTAGFVGGGVLAATIKRGVLTGNSATHAGGAYQSTLNNCLIKNNSANNTGGGTYSCTLTNCTVSGNSAGIFGGGSREDVVRNSIVYNNTASSEPEFNASSFVYSCTTPLPVGAGNIAVNPLFVSASDFRLGTGSPAIGAGSNALAPVGPDLDGNPRIDDPTVDLGPYEVIIVANHDATLSGLTLSVGLLNPNFSSAANLFTANVANLVTSLTVTATVAQTGATLTIQGAAVASGTASASLSLAVGANPIAMLVTARDGTTSKIITLTVLRAAPPGGIAVTNLTDTGTDSLRAVFDTLSLDASFTSLHLGGQGFTPGAAFNPYPLLRPASGTLTVEGDGATLDGGGMNRPFFVYSGAVKIRNVTLANTKASGGNGVLGGGGGAGLGGAIFVYRGAQVTAENVTFSANSASGGNGGAHTLIAGIMGAAGGGGGMGGHGGGVESQEFPEFGGRGGGGGGLGGNGGFGSASSGGGGGGGIRAGSFIAYGGNGNSLAGTDGGFVGGVDAGRAGALPTVLGIYGGGGSQQISEGRYPGDPGAKGGGGGGGARRMGNNMGTAGGGGGLVAGSHYTSSGSTIWVGSVSGVDGGFGGGGGGADWDNSVYEFHYSLKGGEGGFGGGGGGGGMNDAEKNAPGHGGRGGFGGGGGGANLSKSLGAIGGSGGFGGGGGGGRARAMLYSDLTQVKSGPGGSGGFGGGAGATAPASTEFVPPGQGGGGGLGAGGAVYVMTGGSLVLIDPTFSGSAFTVSGGASGGNGSGAGQSIGAGLFLGGNAEIRISSGRTVTLPALNDFIGGGADPEASGSLTKSGPGTLVVSGPNSYVGGTILAGGVLSVSNENQLGAATAPLNVTGGILRVTGTTLSTLGRGMTFVSGGFDVADAALTLTLSQTLAGAGGLSKDGTGNLRLTGTVAYQGATALNAGTLQLDNGLGGSGGTVTVASGATLLVRGSVARRISGSGTITANAGPLDLGDLANPVGFDLSAGSGGTLNVGANQVVLFSLGRAVLGQQTNLSSGGRLMTLHGLQLGNAATLDASKFLSATGPSIVQGAFVNNGTVQGPVGPGQALILQDAVSGAGSFSGNVTFLGGYSPGNSPASVTLESPTFAATNTLSLELGRTASDHLRFTGIATLGGTLVVTLVKEFTPVRGDRFELFSGPTTGAFDSISLPTLPVGLAWDTSEFSTRGLLTIGGAKQ